MSILQFQFQWPKIISESINTEIPDSFQFQWTILNAVLHLYMVIYFFLYPEMDVQATVNSLGIIQLQASLFIYHSRGR